MHKPIRKSNVSPMTAMLLATLGFLNPEKFFSNLRFERIEDDGDLAGAERTFTLIVLRS